MIEITIKEMIDSVAALRDINDKKMPARTAYQFARIIREIEKELQSFREARQKTIERYGKKDSTGQLIYKEDGTVDIFPDKMDDFNKESQELLNSTIKINCEKVSLEDIMNNEFSPSEINKLFIFIKE